MSDIEKWLKTHPDVYATIVWGSMTGRWDGYDERQSGYIVSLFRNGQILGSSAPHDTIKESFDVVAENVNDQINRNG